jgi:putative transposase
MLTRRSVDDRNINNYVPNDQVFVRARLQPCRKQMRGRAALAAEGMAIPKRHHSVPGTYFVTPRTWESRAIFNVAPPCEVFVESLLHYRDEGAYLLHGFVLMPDHFHVLITPGEEIALERAVQFIKGGSARAIRERLIFRFPVWQRGFSDHRIRDAADFDGHMRYVAHNPVKRHLVLTPNEYPWSSVSRAFRLDEVPQGLKPLSPAAAVGTAKAVP